MPKSKSELKGGAHDVLAALFIEEGFTITRLSLGDDLANREVDNLITGDANELT